jgi:hypothetical protein
MSNVVNLGRGKMTAENLAHEIPWKDLKHVYLVAERKDGRIMIGATTMDGKTAALLRMVSEDVLADLAHFGLAADQQQDCGDPNCESCGPIPPPPPTDEDPNGELQ